MEKEINSQMNIGEIINMVVRRRLLFAIPCLCIFAISIAISFILPKTYETASLIQAGNKKMIDPLVSGLAVSPDIKDEIDNLSKQITAWPRLELLVSQLHMADEISNSQAKKEDYIKKLKSRISIRPKSKDIIEIAYMDKNPLLAQQVVNTLTQNFLEENSRLQREEARNAIDFISEQLKIYRKKLESSQTDFISNKIDSDIRIAENRRAILKDKITNLQKIIPSQITTEQNPVVSQLSIRLGQLESEIARLMLDAKEGNPKVIELKKEIENIRGKINVEMEKRTVKESISTYNPLYLQTEQDLKQVDMEIDYLQKRKNNITKGDSKALKEISEEEIANLERNKKVDEDIYQMLLKQLEAAYVSERLQDSEKGSRFTILEYARLSMRPVKPKKERIIAMGVFGGIGVGFCLVFLIETIKKSFYTAEQVKELLNIHSLSSISKIVINAKEIKISPLKEIKDFIFSNKIFSKIKMVYPHIAKKVFDQKISEQIIMYHEPECEVAEEFRVLRTNLFHGIETSMPIKTILVTSSLKGEGKSTVSSNLAVALADSGKNTLLIDCDLRRGIMNNLFALPQSPGLVDVLSNVADVNAVLLKTIIKNLTIFPCGNVTRIPSELLGLEKMETIINEFRSKYDVVILDAPPILNLPDSCILTKYADAVIMVIQAGRTKRQDTIQSLNILKQINASIAGFVMTNVEYYMPKYMYDSYYRR